jgi:hypothetical protein
MKKLILILFLAPIWFSCEEDKPVTDPVKDSLTDETNRLTSMTADQAAALDSFFRAMNDIQRTLMRSVKRKRSLRKTRPKAT